jgi:hypothetical protein
MENDGYIGLEEWIRSNTSHGISEKESIRSYTEYTMDNFDRAQTVDLISTMIESLREMYIYGEQLDTIHQELIVDFFKLQEEVDLLRRNIKNLTKK